MNNREKQLYETVMDVCDNIVKESLHITEDVNYSDLTEFNDQFLTDVNEPLNVNGELELYLTADELEDHCITRDMCCDVLSQCGNSITGYWIDGSDLQVIGSKRNPSEFNQFLQKFAMIYDPDGGYEELRSLAGF